MNQNNSLNTNKWKNLKCPKCGKTNIGWQTHCLLCGANLSESNSQNEPVYKCTSCSATVNKGQKFCTSCGSKLPEDLEPVVEETPEVKKCSNCGAALKADAKFCTKCGEKV